MTRKQNRYADQAANEARINGETITAGRNVREFIERYGHHERPADQLRSVALAARERRAEGKKWPLLIRKGSTSAVIRAERR